MKKKQQSEPEVQESLAVGADEITVGPSYPSLDKILPQAFKALKIPAQITGATERGWSRMKVLQACPYLYAVRYRGILGEAPAFERRPAAEIGILFHAMAALYYRPGKRGLDRRYADRLLQVVAGFGADPEVTGEVGRIWDAYLAYYAQDYLRPLASEYEGIDQDGNTCRFDTIVAIDADQGLVPAGLYVLEHKTRSRFDASATMWENDGEILGQINAAVTDPKFEATFGAPLSGILVNVVGRQKEPKFARFPIPVEERHASHMADLRVWRAVESMYEATGTWPRARNSCIGQYGPCELYQTCADPGTGEICLPPDNEEEPK